MSVDVKKELKVDPVKGELKILGHRVILASVEVLTGVHQELIDTIGPVGGTIMYRATKNATLKEGKIALDRSPVIKLLAKTNWGKKRLVEKWIPTFNSFGFGALEIVEIKPKEKIVLRLKNSISAAGIKSTAPRCHLLRGLFAGGFSVLLKNDYEAEETKCIAMGDPYCEFLILPTHK